MDELPTSAVDPLAAEAALASIGLHNVLDGEPKWGAIERHRAAQLPKAIRSMLVRFMSDGDRPETADLPQYKHEDIGKLLADGPQEDHALALQKAIGDPNLALAVATAATRIVHTLQPLYPRPTKVSNVAGLQSVPATPYTSRAFARVWSVACDPMIVLRDLLEGCLSPDMVHAFELLYPNLYALTLQMVGDVYASLKAKRPKFDLTGHKDRQIGVLQGKSQATSNLPLAAEFQQVAAFKPPTPPLGDVGASTSNALQTPGQSS
jgi:hypothetical protein